MRGGNIGRLVTQLEIGSDFAGYRIDSLLGRGGMGALYLATHLRLGRRAALKVLVPELAADPDFRERFIDESRVAASLDHPNVIPIYDADEVDGILFLAMRYVNGRDLKTMLEQRGRLSTTEASAIVAQAASALDAAHGVGLVHRDVKPENFLIEHGKHVYLTDFGIAKRVGAAGVTKTGSFLGTVGYCAPEQIQGNQVDARADVYALGCVLYQCLTGRTPFPKATEIAVIYAHLMEPPPAVSTVCPDLPETLDAVFATAMAKHPEVRFDTCTALADAVFVALAGKGARQAATVAAPTVPAAIPPLGVEPVTHVPPPPTAPPTELARPRPWQRWLIPALAIATALTAGLAAALMLSGGGGGGHSSTTNEALRTFAVQVGNMLEQSANGRREITAALRAETSCSITPAEAAARLASIAENRQSLLQQVPALNPPTPTAQRIASLFQQALGHSRESNRHYRDWLRAGTSSGSSCTLPQNEDYEAARREDAMATRTKRQFLTAYNAVARSFGLRIWNENEI
jgi:predicted Ser/Thr protein kinase